MIGPRRRPRAPRRGPAPGIRVLLTAGAVLALVLIAAPSALAAAGGGSSGFSDGGGGGGGHGNGFAIYLILDLLLHIAVLGHGLGALVLIVLAAIYFGVTRLGPQLSDWWHTHAAERTARRSRSGGRRPSQRERKVELAAAEASDTDPAFAADAIRASASRLFADVQHAWDGADRMALRGLVGPDLLAEWERRLDDFDRRGWRNHVQVLGEPAIELVGLTHRGDVDSDRAVVRVEARMKDYVVDRSGRHLKRSGRLGETTRIREFWTLGRRADHWLLISIEQAAEGKHALDEQIVATPWADDRGMRDQALVEGAVAEALPEGTAVAEVADLHYDGDAHAAAMDLSVADGRFAPDVLEVAARRAVAAWAEAIDGPDAALRAVATPPGGARAALRRRQLEHDADRGPRPGRQPHPRGRAGRRRAAGADDDRGRPQRPPLRGEPRHRRGRGRQPHPQDQLHRALDLQPHRRRRPAVAGHRRLLPRCPGRRAASRYAGRPPVGRVRPIRWSGGRCCWR